MTSISKSQSDLEMEIEFKNDVEAMGLNFAPESLLEHPISDRNGPFAAFIAGCLVAEGIIPFAGLKDDPSSMVRAMLIISRCLDLLPPDGDMFTLALDNLAKLAERSK